MITNQTHLLWKKRAAMTMGSGLVLFLLVQSSLADTEKKSASTILSGDIAEIEQALAEQDSVNVIIWLRDNEFTSPRYQADLDKKREAIRTLQEDVLADLAAGDFSIKYRYKVSNGFAGAVSRSGFEKLKTHPSVAQIVLDRPVHITLDESRPLIRADEVEETLDVTGEGVTICVLDTGIDYTHPDLGGCLGPTCKVVGGYDYCTGSSCSGPNDADPTDEHGHGTHVAGIVASADSLYRGIAPGANLAALKVLNATGSGTFSALSAAIDWCANNRATYNIKVITMSLGDGGEYSDANCPDYSNPALENAYNAGIFIDASSGNNAYINGVSSPACAPWVMSVGAVYDANVGSKAWTSCTDSTTQADKMTCFTNRGSNLDVLAPGSVITSTAGKRGSSCGAPSGGFGDCSGTPWPLPISPVLRPCSFRLTRP